MQRHHRPGTSQVGGLGAALLVVSVAVLSAGMWSRSLSSDGTPGGMPSRDSEGVAVSSPYQNNTTPVNWSIDVLPIPTIGVRLNFAVQLAVSGGTIDVGTSLPAAVSLTAPSLATVSMTYNNLTVPVPIDPLGHVGPMPIPGLSYTYLGVQFAIDAALRTTISANCATTGAGTGCGGPIVWTASGARQFSLNLSSTDHPGDVVGIAVSNVTYGVQLNVTAVGTIPLLGSTTVTLLPWRSIGNFSGTPTSVAGEFRVTALPSVAGLSVSPTSVTRGSSVTIATSASGGSGTLAYAYRGLPDGCTSADAASWSCAPSSTGQFGLSVDVTDAQGKTASGNVNLTVVPPGPASAILAALSSPLLWLALAAVIVGILLMVVYIRRRRRPSPDS